MFDKIKRWIAAAGAAVIGFLLVLLHVKQSKIKVLNSEVRKAQANSTVQKGSVEILENQLKQERELNESKDSYNNIVDSFNNIK